MNSLIGWVVFLIILIRFVFAEEEEGSLIGGGGGGGGGGDPPPPPPPPHAANIARLAATVQRLSNFTALNLIIWFPTAFIHLSIQSAYRSTLGQSTGHRHGAAA